MQASSAICGNRHLQSIIQRTKPKIQDPAVSHHPKEPLATGEIKSKRDLMEAGRCQSWQDKSEPISTVGTFPEPPVGSSPWTFTRTQRSAWISKFSIHTNKGTGKVKCWGKKSQNCSQVVLALAGRGRAELPGRDPTLTRSHQCHSPGSSDLSLLFWTSPFFFFSFCDLRFNPPVQMAHSQLFPCQI